MDQPCVVAVSSMMQSPFCHWMLQPAVGCRNKSNLQVCSCLRHECDVNDGPSICNAWLFAVCQSSLTS